MISKDVLLFHHIINSFLYVWKYQVVAGNVLGNLLCLCSSLGKTKLWGGHSCFLRKTILTKMTHFQKTHGDIKSKIHNILTWLKTLLVKMTHLQKTHGDMLMHRKLPLLLDS